MAAPPPPDDARPLREFLAALGREWRALIVGVTFALALTFIPGMTHAEVPQWLWGVSLVVAVLPASYLAWRKQYLRAESWEDADRNRKRAQEIKDYNVPSGFRRGALAFAAAIPNGLTAESNAGLAQLIDKALVGLDRDTRYVIGRERGSETFGPFDDLQGRYGKLRPQDVKAELQKMIQLGLVEKVPDGEAAGRYRWTPFGYAVIGKLGKQLD